MQVRPQLQAAVQALRRAFPYSVRFVIANGDARPIAKGLLGRAVEFGHTAQVVDNIDAIVLDRAIERAILPMRRN